MAAKDAILNITSYERVHYGSLDCEPMLIFWTLPQGRDRCRTWALELAY